MVEMGEDRVPAARRDALARYWGCTPAQRERLDAALELWCSSAIRAEALAWPQVRAEVPFFSLGADDLTERFGEFAEGAIDLLCTDPDDPARALVIDYKTGGSSQETPSSCKISTPCRRMCTPTCCTRRGLSGLTLRLYVWRWKIRRLRASPRL